MKKGLTMETRQDGILNSEENRTMNAFGVCVCKWCLELKDGSVYYIYIDDDNNKTIKGHNTETLHPQLESYDEVFRFKCLAAEFIDNIRHIDRCHCETCKERAIHAKQEYQKRFGDDFPSFEWIKGKKVFTEKKE